MIRLFCVHFFLVVLAATKAYSQKETLFVIKESCFFLNKFKGSKLVLNHKQDSITYRSSLYNYDLNHFINLNDSDKLILIEQLLKYEKDNSLCCLDVIGHGFNGIEGCRGVPISKRYSIQIDALYIINRLCWPKNMELYSCYNVLFDTLTKKEINHNNEKILLFFKEYENWYRQCKIHNKIDKDFSFNNGRYKWFAGRKSSDPE